MATRAIKKLTKKDELTALEEIQKKVGGGVDEAEGSDSDSGPVEPAVVNKFNLVSWPRPASSKRNAQPLSFCFQLNEDDGPSEEPSGQSEPEAAKSESKPSKKKDKKKKKSKSKDAEDKSVFKFVSSVDADDDDDDAAAAAASAVNEPSMHSKTKHLLQIESKHLNYDNEMIRMFGARIVQNERANAAAG